MIAAGYSTRCCEGNLISLCQWLVVLLWCLCGLQVVTRDATPAAGSAPDCVDNVRGAFKQLFATGSSPQGRSQLQQTFKLCDALPDEQQVLQLAYWAQVRKR